MRLITIHKPVDSPAKRSITTSGDPYSVPTDTSCRYIDSIGGSRNPRSQHNKFGKVEDNTATPKGLLKSKRNTLTKTTAVIDIKNSIPSNAINNNRDNNLVNPHSSQHKNITVQPDHDRDIALMNTALPPILRSKPEIKGKVYGKPLEVLNTILDLNNNTTKLPKPRGSCTGPSRTAKGSQIPVP
jgi:hypothetical protein